MEIEPGIPYSVTVTDAMSLTPSAAVKLIGGKKGLLI